MTETSTISADARIALRKAVTNDPRWDAYRVENKLSLATMVKADWHKVVQDFGIDISKLAISVSVERDINQAFTGQRSSVIDKDARTVTATAPRPLIAQAKADFAAPLNSKLDPSQFPARGPVWAPPVKSDKVDADKFPVLAAAQRDVATAQAKADFAPENDANDAPEFDHNDIPSVPLPLTDAQLAKIDSIIALAVDPDISMRALYSTARRAVFCAESLKTALAFEIEHGAAKRDPHAQIVKSSLDFVAPSWSRDFLDYLDIGATVAVVGPSGNGKTTGARKLLERAGWNVYEFDCTDATLPQDLIGRTSLRQDSGATVTDWAPGPLALAFNDPKGAVLLNEYDALDPRTGMALQSALESAEVRRVTAPDTGEQIRSHGPCPIVLTLNTIGHGATVEYQGRNALDGANRDRVEIIVTGYEHEAEILVAHGFQNETAERLANWAKVARETLAKINSKEILSNRRLLTAAALMDRRGASLTDAIKKAFVCRMAPREAQAFTA